MALPACPPLHHASLPPRRRLQGSRAHRPSGPSLWPASLQAAVAQQRQGARTAAVAQQGPSGQRQGQGWS